MPSLKLSFVCTVRGVDRYRVDNCTAVLHWYQARFPEAGFTLVEQDSQSRFAADSLPPGIDHIRAHNPGAFNKSWGINIGVRAAVGDILVILDADMLVDSADLRRSIDAVDRQLQVVRPYRRLIDLGPEESRHYHETGRLPCAPDAGRGFDRGYQGERICLAGGVFVIRRSLFESVGGFDERFRGWGGEDDAFSLRVEAATRLSAIAREGIAWHLWHPRQAGPDNPHYHRNLALLAQYRLWRTGAAEAPPVPAPESIGVIDRYRDVSA